MRAAPGWGTFVKWHRNLHVNFCIVFSRDGENADFLKAVLFINRQGISDLEGCKNCFLPCTGVPIEVKDFSTCHFVTWAADVNGTPPSQHCMPPSTKFSGISLYIILL